MTVIDGNHNWTAQSSHGWVHDEGAPGNVFDEHELPHPELQKAAGINPDVYRSQHGLHVRPSDVKRPEFKGTETGAHPSATSTHLGTSESFQSYLEELEEELAVEETEKPKRSTKK